MQTGVCNHSHYCHCGTIFVMIMAGLDSFSNKSPEISGNVYCEEHMIILSNFMTKKYLLDVQRSLLM